MNLKIDMRTSIVIIVTLALVLSNTAVVIGNSEPADEGSSWPMFGGGRDNDSRIDNAAKESSGSLNWDLKLEGNLDSSPSIGPEGDIYVGSSEGYLYSLSPGGEKNWRFNASAGIDSSPAVGEEGNIYFGDRNGNFYSLYSNGTLRWVRDIGAPFEGIGENATPSPIFSSPVVTSDGSILVAIQRSMLFSFYSNGTVEWKYNPGGYILSTPAVDEDGRIYLGMVVPILGWGRMESLSPSGEEIWNYTIEESGTGIYSSPTVDSEKDIYFGSNNGTLYSLDKDGNLNWRFETQGQIFSSPAIGKDGTIYVGSADGNLYAVKSDGTEKWRYKTGGAIYSSPSVGSYGNIYFGSDDTKFYSLRSDGVKRWTVQTDGKIFSSPAIDLEGNVYFGSADGHFYSIGTRDQSWFSLHIPLIGGVLLFIVVFVPFDDKS